MNRRRWISSREKERDGTNSEEGRATVPALISQSLFVWLFEMLHQGHDRCAISSATRKPVRIENGVERISNERRQLRVTYFHCHDCREPRNVPPRHAAPRRVIRSLHRGYPIRAIDEPTHQQPSTIDDFYFDLFLLKFLQNSSTSFFFRRNRRRSWNSMQIRSGARLVLWIGCRLIEPTFTYTFHMRFVHPIRSCYR